MECPRCHSATDHHVIRGPRNVAISIVNALHAVWWLGWVPFVSWKRATTPRSPLLRRCLKCGYKFLGEVPEAPDFDECPACAYNLKGNTSGRCPECGWKLPRRIRAHRRLADRGLPKPVPPSEHYPKR